MNDLVLKKLNSASITDFQKYIKSNFYETYIVGDKTYLRWQFDGIILALHRGQIIGHLGFKDYTYSRIGTVRVFMSLYVCEKYRLSGVAALVLLEALGAKKYFLTSGLTPLTDALCGKTIPGWQSSRNMNKFLAVLEDHPRIAEYGLQEKIRLEAVSAGKEPTARQCSALWEKVRDNYPITLERTEKYLNWRFFKHPFFSYEIAAVSAENNLKGFLMWRVEQHDSFRIARVVDAIAEPAYQEMLFSQFLSAAKHAHAHAADFLCSGDLYRESLKKAGFFDTKGSQFESFPILWTPLSTKKTFINVAHDLPQSIDEMFLTKADGDQDRPNPSVH